MGLHNATVVVRSLETPPKFAEAQNTSLFLSVTVGAPPAAAADAAPPEGGA